MRINDRTNRKERVKELFHSFQVLMGNVAPHARVYKSMPQITPAQAGVLMLLKRCGRGTVRDIAKTLRVTSSAATQLVDKLVKGGHVIRETDPEDRRSVLLTLSRRTKRLSDTIENHVIGQSLQVFDVLNDREFEQYVTLNEKVVQGLAVGDRPKAE